MPTSQGLTLQELRELIPPDVQDEALVRRKLMTDVEPQEAMLDPYEEDPEAAEGDALEDELAWKLNVLMTDLVGDLWSRITLYMVPEGSESSWARTLLRTSPEEMRVALEGKRGVE
jgi:hypothetical protein